MKVTVSFVHPDVTITSPFMVAGVGHVALDATGQYVALDYSTNPVEMKMAGELDYRGLNKTLRETLSVQDTVSIVLAKTMDDPVAAADWLGSISLTKVLSETVSTAEILELIFVSVREFADTATAADAAAMVLTKILSDSVATTDAASLALTKAATDSVAVSEAFNSRFTKTLAELVSAGDSHQFSYTKPIADTATSSDAGSLVIQDYAEDYFAEPYVGSLITF